MLKEKTEKLSFLLELRIKDEDREVIKLSKEEVFEITWVVLNGAEKGILNPGKLETYRDEITGKIMETMPSQKETVKFEKDGKKYKVLVGINSMTRGWFKDSLTSFSFLPAKGEKFTIFRDEVVGSRPLGSRQEVSEQIIPLKKRPTGYFVLGGVALLLAIGGVLVWYFWKKKQNS